MNTNTDNTGRQLSKFSTEEWIGLVAEYRKSGFTLNAFAKANDINPNTFKYWIYDVKKSKKETKKEKIQKQNFVEITSALKNNKIDVEVIMPNGVRVNLNLASKDDVSFVIKEVATCLD